MAVPVVSPRRAVLDVVVQIVGRFGNLVLGIVATAILARGLGDAEYGVWTTLLLVPTLLGNLTDLGLQQVAVRLATAEDDARWIGALVSAKAALAIPTYFVAVIAFVALGLHGSMLTAGAIIAVQMFLAVPAALSSVFQVHIRNDLTIAALTANSLLWLGAVWVITRSGSSLVTLALAIVAAQTLTTGIQAIYALRFGKVVIRGTWTRWRRLARTAIPLSIGTLLIVAYGRIDGLIVYAAAGKVGAGLYGAAYRILDQSAFVPMSLTVTLMPILTRMWPADREQARRLLQTTLELLAMASFFALSFSLAAPRAIVVLLYGKEFLKAADAVPVLMGAFVLISVGYAVGIYTLVLELTRRFAVYALLALVVNVVANLVLVPRYGFMAAAWVTVGTEAVVTGLIGRAVLKTLEMRLALGRLVRIAIAAAIAGGVVTPLSGAGLSALILLPIGLFVHIAALVAFRVLGSAELNALRRGDPGAAL